VTIKVDWARFKKPHERQRPVAESREMKWASWCLENYSTRARHTVDCVADHLRTERWEALTKSPVGHMMQRDPVPDSGFSDQWDERIADLGESSLQCDQTSTLLRRGVESDPNLRFHIGTLSRFPI
jgi:hypothetical protein